MSRSTKIAKTGRTAINPELQLRADVVVCIRRQQDVLDADEPAADPREAQDLIHHYRAMLRASRADAKTDALTPQQAADARPQTAGELQAAGSLEQFHASVNLGIVTRSGRNAVAYPGSGKHSTHPFTAGYGSARKAYRLHAAAAEALHRACEAVAFGKPTARTLTGSFTSGAAASA